MNRDPTYNVYSILFSQSKLYICGCFHIHYPDIMYETLYVIYKCKPCIILGSHYIGGVIQVSLLVL